MRSFQRGIIWPCRLKYCRDASLHSLQGEDERTIYYVNCIKTLVPGKHSALNAGNFEVFQATRSYNTSLERSHQFLKDKKVHKALRPLYENFIQKCQIFEYSEIYFSGPFLYWCWRKYIIFCEQRLKNLKKVFLNSSFGNFFFYHTN